MSMAGQRFFPLSFPSLLPLFLSSWPQGLLITTQKKTKRRRESRRKEGRLEEQSERYLIFLFLVFFSLSPLLFVLGFTRQGTLLGKADFTTLVEVF